jgi:hypothetical protein
VQSHAVTTPKEPAIGKSRLPKEHCSRDFPIAPLRPSLSSKIVKLYTKEAARCSSRLPTNLADNFRPSHLVHLGVNRSTVICSPGIGKSRPFAPKSKIWQNRGFGNPLGAKLTVGSFPPWCTKGLASHIRVRQVGIPPWRSRLHPDIPLPPLECRRGSLYKNQRSERPRHTRPRRALAWSR